MSKDTDYLCDPLADAVASLVQAMSRLMIAAQQESESEYHSLYTAQRLDLAFRVLGPLQAQIWATMEILERTIREVQKDVEA